MNEQLTLMKDLYASIEAEKDLQKKWIKILRILEFYKNRIADRNVANIFEGCALRVRFILGDLSPSNHLGMSIYQEEKIMHSRAVSDSLRAIYSIIRDHDLSDLENQVLNYIIKDLESIK